MPLSASLLTAAEGFRLGFGEYCSGFIENKYFYACLVYLPCNFDKLRVSHEASDHSKFVNTHVELVQRLAGIVIHLDHIKGFKSFPEHPGTIFGEVISLLILMFSVIVARNKHEFLVNHSDTGIHCLVGRFKVYELSVYQDFALITTGTCYHRHPEQDIHQGGFAGAVLSDKSVYLSPFYIKINVRQNAVSIVVLRNIFKLEKTLAQRIPPCIIKRYEKSRKKEGTNGIGTCASAFDA